MQAVHYIAKQVKKYGKHFQIAGNKDKRGVTTQRATLDYLAVGLPMGKLGFGFGLIPYSSVGYKVESIAADEIPKI